MSSSSEGISWISWFCTLRGHEYFCEVSENFITESFNLRELSGQVPHYREALKMILNEESLDLAQADDDGVEQAAEMLYGLIHARYILTKVGLKEMLSKYLSGDFGVCPRTFCHSQTVLPIGLSDIPGQDTVKLYCPVCLDVYKAKSTCRYTDGAYFGTSFPEMLFMTFPERRPKTRTQYIPRLFGFKIHPSAHGVSQ